MTPGRDPLLVVGSGIAGLVAAHHLRSAGWPVIVLEAGDHAGGRIRTIERDGCILETGAAIVATSYDRVLATIEAVGLAEDLVPVPSVLGIVTPDRVEHLDTAHPLRDGLRTRVLPVRSKLRMVRLLADARRLTPSMSYSGISGVHREDGETGQAYCARRLDDLAFDRVVGLVLRGVNGVDASHASVLELFFILTKLFGSQMRAFGGGMSGLVDALCHGLDVRLGCRVDNVREVGGEVEVRWRDATGAEQTQRSPACVVAVPGDLVPDVVDGLDPVAEQLLRGVEYATMVNLNVVLGRRPQGLRGFAVQVPASISTGLATISLDHAVPARAPEGTGAIGCYATSSWSRQLIDQDDETVTAAVLAEADRVVPGLVDDVTWVGVNRWSRSVVYARPGTFGNLAGAADGLRRPGRVQLAGDYFSSSNLNTASHAGMRAARGVLQALAPGDRVVVGALPSES